MISTMTTYQRAKALGEGVHDCGLFRGTLDIQIGSVIRVLWVSGESEFNFGKARFVDFTQLGSESIGRFNGTEFELITTDLERLKIIAFIESKINQVYIAKLKAK